MSIKQLTSKFMLNTNPYDPQTSKFNSNTCNSALEET